MPISVEKKIHKGFAEAEKAQVNIPCPFGKYQYIYSSEKGKISLVELHDYFWDGVTVWEIYCLEGELFDDVERFKSKEEAEERIKELMEAKDG